MVSFRKGLAMPMYRNQWQDYTDDHWEPPEPSSWDDWHVPGWLDMTEEQRDRMLLFMNDLEKFGIDVALELNRDRELSYAPIDPDDDRP